MLDFRYHALSLVAVFLALAIGIVLGVTIGDSLLSDAERSLRSSLRANLVDARDNWHSAEAQVAARDRMLDQIYPSLVSDRLRGERIAIVSWGPIPDSVESGVRDAIKQGAGHVDSVAVIDKPLTELKRVVGNDRFKVLSGDDHALQALGSSLADGFVDGGRVGKRLQALYPDDYAGRFHHADAVAFFEPPEPNGNTDAAGVKERSDARSKSIEAALLGAFSSRAVAVVGVEATNTDPSQIPHYESLKLTTVDSVDKSGGKIALVFALAGAQGNFGFKPTAKQPLPDEALTP